jgi:RecQ family ATP-dependent DNA helicase
MGDYNINISINKEKTKQKSKAKSKSSSLSNLSEYLDYEFSDDENNENKVSKININDIVNKMPVYDYNKMTLQEIFEKINPGKILKEKQVEILNSILINKKDTIGILATGYGKSICYQLPYLYYNMKKSIIIISPLISLMEDQSEKLKQMGMPVFSFHSGINKRAREIFKNELINSSEGKIIYLTPEYLSKCENFIKDLANNNKLAIIAIDEAHCISTWGNDFRKDYQSLYYFRDWVPTIPILALTATATKRVETDMITQLQLKNPLMVRSSFNRPNLYLACYMKPEKINVIYELLNKHKNNSTIIYCKTRVKADNINKKLVAAGYSSDVYHAGLHTLVRKEIQRKFAEKEINVIVATVAFGMGIDQTVRLVIHWGCPCDIESYYQEIGRAGRDNLPAECHLYYDNSDFKLSRFLIGKVQNEHVKKFREEQLTYMERLCYIDKCRKRYILENFDENIEDCGNCDNCINQNKVSEHITRNIMYPVYLIVKTILLAKCKLGMNKIILIIKGSNNKIVMNMNTYKTYGLEKKISEENYKSIIKLLIYNNYLKEKSIAGGYGTVLETNQNIIKWINDIDNIMKIKKIKTIDYDSIYKILDDNLLVLDITNSFKKLENIKFTSIIDDFISEFDLDNI